MSIQQPPSSAPSQFAVNPSGGFQILAEILERLCRRPTAPANAEGPGAPETAAHGLEMLLSLMPRFDLGDWSACNIDGSRASPEQHAVHIRLLAQLARQTSDQRVLGWHDRFVEYRDIAGGKAGKLKLPWKSGQPAGDNYHDRIAQSYLAQRVHQPIWQAEHNAVASFLDQLPRGQSVLDVPFGTGRFVPLYLERGMSVTGIDISDAMLNEARRALGPAAGAVVMLRADASKLPLAGQSFDGAICVRFLESIIPFAMVRPVLSELRRVCRSWAIVRLNNRSAELPAFDTLPEGGAIMGTHLRMEQLEDLCAECGWRLAQSIVVGHKGRSAQQGEQRICLLRAF